VSVNELLFPRLTQISTLRFPGRGKPMALGELQLLAKKVMSEE
jgi:hypothetical protein